MRVRALAGVVGPVVFTAAWIAASLRQTGHGALSVQLSGLAAPDARDPWIMVTGFGVLGGGALVFGQELASGPVSWHNHAHDVVSLVLYADLVLAQFLLARSFAATACWRPWRRYLLASGTATAAALVIYIPNTTSDAAGALQRAAVTIPLIAMTAVAARLASAGS